MKGTYLMGIIVGLSSVVLLTRSLSAHANDDEAKALRRAGALLWEMTEKHNEYGYRRIARRVTPEEVRKKVESTAAALARNRNALAPLHPKLKPDTRFSKQLAQFLERWPDREAFLTDLMIADGDGKSRGDIVSLAMQVDDPRRKWKTLFPFFRP